MADKKKSGSKAHSTPQGNAFEKKYTYSLSLMNLITLIGSFCVALAFFFVMGILIGRGYQPEADLPQLKQLMPGNAPIDEQPSASKPEILKPEELNYAERLQENPAAPHSGEAKQDHKQPQVTPQPEPKTELSLKPTPVIPSAPKREDGKEFDYTYQVASFKQKDMAESLSNKLRTAGLNTRIVSGDVKGKTWYRVHVLHRGTSASLLPLKTLLSKHGIKKPFLKRKKALR